MRELDFYEAKTKDGKKIYGYPYIKKAVFDGQQRVAKIEFGMFARIAVEKEFDHAIEEDVVNMIEPECFDIQPGTIQKTYECDGYVFAMQELFDAWCSKRKAKLIAYYNETFAGRQMDFIRKKAYYKWSHKYSNIKGDKEPNYKFLKRLRELCVPGNDFAIHEKDFKDCLPEICVLGTLGNTIFRLLKYKFSNKKEMLVFVERLLKSEELPIYRVSINGESGFVEKNR